MKRPKVCVLRTAGTNCDQETAAAFARVGGAPELIHVNRFIEGARTLSEFHILAMPGGFSYGDDIAAGKILANEFKNRLADDLRRFIADGKLMIGICNGFQAMVKAGLLPGNDTLRQEATLTINDSAKFEDRWVYLRVTGDGFADTGRGAADTAGKCVWTKGLPGVIYLPVAHGEGKFIPCDAKLLTQLKKNGQVVFRYCDEKGRPGNYPVNPNGSQDDIAGICDATGRILGLMPHPERHMEVSQHPRWEGDSRNGEGDGLQIFRNGMVYCQKHL